MEKGIRRRKEGWRKRERKGGKEGRREQGEREITK